MDPLYQEGEELLWAFSPEPPVLAPSSFVRYSDCIGSLKQASPPCRNIHRRMMELLRRIPNCKPEPGDSYAFRHMMRERHRREKLSQSYADLHSMLSSTKADKNSIVQSAAAYVRELKGVKEELEMRNDELKRKFTAARGGRECDEGEEVRIMAGNSASAIESMIGALEFLKSMEVKAFAIRTESFSGGGLSAVVSLETNKVRAAELERGVEGALKEVERKFLAQFAPSSSVRSSG